MAEKFAYTSQISVCRRDSNSYRITQTNSSVPGGDLPEENSTTDLGTPELESSRDEIYRDRGSIQATSLWEFFHFYFGNCTAEESAVVPRLFHRV